MLTLRNMTWNMVWMSFEMLSIMPYRYNLENLGSGAHCAQEEAPLRGRDPAENTEYPASKVHGANMGPTWVLSAPDGLHVGPMNLALRVFQVIHYLLWRYRYLIWLNTGVSNVIYDIMISYRSN